jgi:hypothetical protein
MNFGLVNLNQKLSAVLDMKTWDNAVDELNGSKHALNCPLIYNCKSDFLPLLPNILFPDPTHSSFSYVCEKWTFLNN